MGNGAPLGSTCEGDDASASLPDGDLGAPDSASHWSPQVRRTIVARRAPRAAPDRTAAPPSVWGSELHPRPISSRRLMVTRLAVERRERTQG